MVAEKNIDEPRANERIIEMELERLGLAATNLGELWRMVIMKNLFIMINHIQ